MKTSTPTLQQQKDRKWFVIDAKGKVLGRLATQVADVLRGKHKATFTPHMDMGDHVIVINVAEIEVTGMKRTQKRYVTHSGFPGALKVSTYADMLEKRPVDAFRLAVAGMLPKNKLRDAFLKKLHLYAGENHQHEAQQPQPLEV